MRQKLLEKSKTPPAGPKWIVAAALIAIVAAAAFQAGRWWPGSAPAPGQPRQLAAPGIELDGPATGPSVRPQAGPEPPLPAGSVAEILALPTDFSETYAAYALAAWADETALRALIEDAKRVESDNDRQALIAIFIGRYGEIDPTRALDYIAASDLEMKPNLVYRVFSAWSKLNLDAAVAALSRLGPAERAAAVDAILVAWSDADSAVLADLRERLAAPAVGGGPTAPMVLRIATTDPVAALTEAERLAGQDRMVTIFAIGGIWAQTDPEAALAHSRGIPDPAIRNAMQRGIFVAWVDRDPASVLRLLVPEASETERSAILNTGLLRLAQRDPRLAFDELSSVDDAGLRNTALQRVLRTWAQQDPYAAAAALDELTGEDRLSLGIVVGREFALRAPAEALDWASRFDDAVAGIYRTVLTEVARTDARIALDSAAAMEASGDPGLFALILATVAERDPVAAAGYWQEVPVDARGNAAVALVGRWQTRDPGAAADWLLGLPVGPDRDAGLVSFVDSAPGDDPDALRLLNAITSAEFRDRVAVGRIGMLARIGQLAQAERELAQMGLSAEAYREARTTIDAYR